MKINLSHTEENYLKNIFSISTETGGPVSTSAIAEKLDTKSSSVTDMVKKLSDKELLHYKKYQGVSLTDFGKSIAINIIRKHRLWEVFLVDHLSFQWDEVHEVAEQLEHVRSTELVNRLDAFLGHPKVDPHGDPIPDQNGNIQDNGGVILSKFKLNESGLIVGVKDTSKSFLNYLNHLKIELGSSVKVIEVEPFDQSMLIEINNNTHRISNLIAQNLYIKTEDLC